jgi:hypothetical protein
MFVRATAVRLPQTQWDFIGRYPVGMSAGYTLFPLLLSCLRAILHEVRVLFMQLILCHSSEVVCILVLEGQFGVLLDGFAAAADWLHADYVEPLSLLVVDVLVLDAQQTGAVVGQVRSGWVRRERPLLRGA